MSQFGFGKRSRKRKSRRSGRKTRRSGRKSRKSSKLERVGNKIKIAGRGGKMKSLKIKKNSEGREYYVSGKRKTKHFLDKASGKRRSRRRSRRSRRRSSRRRFGYMKGGLINMMGNFSPAQMSLAQSTTGFSSPQMMRHMKGISPSNLSNFYTNIR